MRIFVELRERGVALLLVEEKARDVLEIADSVAFLSLGEITWHGPRGEVDADAGRGIPGRIAESPHARPGGPAEATR